MITRNSYTKKLDLGQLSMSNEPPYDYLRGEQFRQYPDMQEIYALFSKKFGIPLNRFILTNGGENAVKNTLLALKPKNLLYSVPTWEMIDVFCEALDIIPIKNNLIYFKKTKSVIESVPETKYRKVDCFYSCLHYNNLTGYKSSQDYTYSGAKYNILDATYVFPNYLECYSDNNTIVVGSFDKLFGVGLRLGYVIFPEELNDKFQLQREQFINYSACKFLEWICHKNINMLHRNMKLEAEEKLFFMQDFVPRDRLYGSNYTWNYLTILGEVKELKNKKEFYIGDQLFTRIGIPANEGQMKEVLHALSILKQDN